MPYNSLRFRTCAATVVSTLLIAQTAHAEQSDYTSIQNDLARPIDHWAGSYVGGHVSFLGAGSEIKRGAGFKKFKQSQGNVALGLHAGYNFAPFGGSRNSGWMIGTEFALSFADLKRRKTDPVLGAVKTTGNFLSSTTLRAGYVWENLYLYGSAGLGFSDFNTKPVGKKGTDINVGLTYGLGVEYATSDRWSLRLDANAYDLGNGPFRFNGTKRNVEKAIVQVKLGASYRF